MAGSYSYAHYTGTINWPSGTYIPGDTVTISGTGLLYQWCSNGATDSLEDFKVIKLSGDGNINWGNAQVNNSLNTWSISGTVTDVGDGGAYKARVKAYDDDGDWQNIGKSNIDLESPTMQSGTVDNVSGTFIPGDTITLTGDRAYVAYSDETIAGYASYSISDNGGDGQINWGSFSYPTNDTWRITGTVESTPNSGGSHSYTITSSYKSLNNTEDTISINLASRSLNIGTVNIISGDKYYKPGDTITLSGNRANVKYSTGEVEDKANYSASRVSGRSDAINWGSISYNNGNWQIEGTVNDVNQLETYTLKITASYTSDEIGYTPKNFQVVELNANKNEKTYVLKTLQGTGTISDSQNVSLNLSPEIIGPPDPETGYSVNHSNLVYEYHQVSLSNNDISHYLTPEEEEQVRQKAEEEYFVNRDIVQSAIPFSIQNHDIVSNMDVDLHINTNNKNGIELQTNEAKLYKVEDGELNYIKDGSIEYNSKNNYTVKLGSAIKDNGSGKYVLRYNGKLLVDIVKNNPTVKEVNNKCSFDFALTSGGTITENTSSSTRVFDVNMRVYNGRVETE